MAIALEPLSRAIVACFATLAGCGATGCVNQLVADAGIGAAMDGAASANTIQDFEVGRSVIEGGIGQVEAFHALSPDNRNGLFLLTKGWTGIGAAFIEDDVERARESGDVQREVYDRLRARAAYARARYFGVELIQLE